jgi:mRNA-degrading endonuclease RelE of RelBE toxin-antitoxin system
MDKKVTKFRVTDEFVKSYENLPKTIQKKVDKQLNFLADNPKHPSLRMHKMNDEWEFYVDVFYRCIFRREGSTYILLTVGGHKIIDHYRK